VVFVYRFGVEEGEGGGAVDGDPVVGVINGDLDVFGEDECIEGVGGGLGEVAVEFDEGAILGFDEPEVGIDAALAVEPETEDGLARLEVIDLGGEHVVEEGVALGAGDFQGRHMGLIEDDGGFAEGGVLHIELAEGFDDWSLVVWALGGAVVEKEGFGGLVDCVEWGGHKMEW